MITITIMIAIIKHQLMLTRMLQLSQCSCESMCRYVQLEPKARWEVLLQQHEPWSHMKWDWVKHTETSQVVFHKTSWFTKGLTIWVTKGSCLGVECHLAWSWTQVIAFALHLSLQIAMLTDWGYSALIPLKMKQERFKRISANTAWRT